MDTGLGPLGDGRYEPLRRIGQGGSGQVWLARDRRLDREVAVKRVPVPGHLPDDERDALRERIRREARAAARIDHPGVAPLFDVVVGEDAIDLVMSYIDAPDLGRLVRREGPLDDAAAAAVGLQVLDVLEAAHAQGVVHRDVKPSNVLVSEDAVHLTDFGIAALADETAMTRTGTALGSPGYVAPEQAEGRAAAPEADLWGLGTLLYHAITGRPPFDRGRPIATMHAVVHEDPDPLDDGHALAPLIGELLSKDPGARPSIATIRQRLEQVAEDGADRAAATRMVAAAATRAIQDPPSQPREDDQRRPPPRRSRHPREEDGRRPLGALLVAAAVLAVLGGLGWALLAPGSDDDADPADPVAAPGSPTTPEARDGTAPSPTGDEGATTEPSPPSGDETAGDPTNDPAAEDQASAPEGWETYDGGAYTVAHPPGWKVRPDGGNRVDLVDPDTGAYLRMDWTDDPKPDPVADWEEQSEAFARNHEDYEEIRIEPVEYRDYDAALWEYEYSEGGGRFHAYNLGLTTGDRGYALNFQTPAASWEELRELFEGFTSSFRPRS